MALATAPKYRKLKNKAVSMVDRTKINEEIIPFIKLCSKEFEFSNADVQAAKKAGIADKLDPCFLGCVFKKSKVINDKGLFDTDKGAEMIKKYLSEEIDQKNALDIISTCKTVNQREVTDGDKGCERAGFLFQCLIPHKGLIDDQGLFDVDKTEELTMKFSDEVYQKKARYIISTCKAASNWDRGLRV